MRLISKLLVSLALLATTYSIHALSLPIVKPYVGADASMQFLSPKHSNTAVRQDRYLPSLNVFGGLKVSDFLGIEAGTLFQKSKNLSGTRLKSNTYHAMLVGTFPIDEGLDALGGVGISHIRYSSKTLAQVLKVNKTVPRFMGGIEYMLIPYVHVRASVTYQHTDGVKVGNFKPNDSFSGSVGLKYSF